MSIEDFVYQNVHSHMSEIVMALAQCCSVDNDYNHVYRAARYLIELAKDWQTAAENEGWEAIPVDGYHYFFNEKREIYWDSHSEELTDDPERPIENHPDCKTWQRLCVSNDISAEFQPVEFYEVSNNLGNLLDTYGEVTQKIGGNQIWCRFSVGQLIQMDTVIQKIYKEHIEQCPRVGR